MSILSQRLSLRASQKQVLTPSLVQMVTLLRCNRLELKEMITQELAESPVREEAHGTDETTQEEIQALLEAERVQDPADAKLVEMVGAGADAAIADAEV